MSMEALASDQVDAVLTGSRKCEAISLSLSHRERDSWRDAEWTQIQCNLNSPLIALSSAGLISLECATRTE
jgi:hypothetical protein